MCTNENNALWLTRKHGSFEVGSAPRAQPASGEIVVRARAVAVNPFERLIRTVGDIITPWLKYPAILGSDVAGEVIALGKDVSRFKIGDRVAGFAAGAEKGRRAAEGAFQEEVVLQARMTTPIPDSIGNEEAAVLPLAIATAAAGLFQQDFLALQPPAGATVSRHETLLVWGGSTSVGCNAIQLAVSAGYEVIATASPRNYDFLKRLGARAVFDRNDPEVVTALIRELAEQRTCGAIAIGVGSTKSCIDVLSASVGNRFIAIASPPVSLDQVRAVKGHWRTLIPVLMRLAIANVRLVFRARRNRVRMKFIWGGSPLNNEVGPMIFEDFLPSALAEERYVAAPGAIIVGQGLGAIPDALELQRKGVSAAKLVVTI
ncbi:MAG TPA: zinc-binding alcohol dehydrogenase family protein [Sphingomicrobium sp.]